MKEIISNIKDENQKISKISEFLKSEPDKYNSIIGGILYGMLNEDLNEYSEYIFCLSKDNHGYLINLIIDVKIKN